MKTDEVKNDKPIECSEEEFLSERMREFWADEEVYHKNIERVNERLFKAIESCLGSWFLNDVKECMEWCESDGRLEIVKKPEGNYQKNTFGQIPGVWVEQWSVGDSGDSFTGTVYVKLKERQYLAISYSC